MNDIVGWSGLLVSLVFVGIAIGLSATQRLGLEREMAVAVVRSLLQLLVVGVALVAVVDPDTPLVWSWLWVVGIVVFAGVTVAGGRRPSRGSRSSPWAPTPRWRR